MSDDNNETLDASCCCASCGIAEIDDVKLVPCDGCDLVRYCGDECQRNHKLEHEEACKKRAAVLRDELLFKQPESSNLGDCPICSLPLPIDGAKSSIYTCCSKLICDGCRYANQKREIEMRLQPSCPFCREALPKTEEECKKLLKKRMEANDPCTITQEGILQYTKREYIIAFEHWKRAAELGDALAHHCLARLYHSGEGVEKDEGKEIHHLEEAAIGGHPEARYMLGSVEGSECNMERAVKHWFIAATQGYDKSIKELMDGFKKGFVSNEKLAAALRAHRAAVDATKSPQRKEAEALYRNI